MGALVPNGSVFALASGYATAKNLTALSNANPGVATLEATHGVVADDILEVTSGWSRLNNRIVKAGVVATNNVPLAGIDTTSLTLFPAGGGVGSVRKISGFTVLSQVLDCKPFGGEQQFETFQYLEADSQERIPTVKGAAGMTLYIADDPTLPFLPLLNAADQDRLPRAVRLTLPNGSILYRSARISFNPTPTIEVNKVMACELTFSFMNAVTRY